MKKIISLLLAVTVLLICTVNSYAWMTKNYIPYFSEGAAEVRGDVYLYDDYTSDVTGESPKNYAVTRQGGDAVVEYIDMGKGKGKNCLVITDNHNPGGNDYIGPSVLRSFDAVSGIVAVEVRFKTEQLNSDMAPFGITLMNGSNQACGVSLPSGSCVLSYVYGDGMTLELAGSGRIPYGEWITVRQIIDLKEKKADVEVQADYLIDSDIEFSALATYDAKKGKVSYSDLAIRSSFKDSEINSVKMSTSRWEGKQYVDYLSVEKNASRLSKRQVKGIEPEYVVEPSEVPSGKYINIKYLNEYRYLKDKAFIESSSVYASAEDMKSIFKLEYTENEKNISILYEGKNAVISNEEIKKVDGKSFLPLRKVLEGIGFEIGWVSETRTVEVRRGM